MSDVDSGRASLRLLLRSRLASEGINAVTSAFQLTTDQWLVLELLVENQRTGLSMADVRSQTGLSSPTVTRIVDHLVTSSLAFRETDPADRRRVTVHCSALGEQTYHESKPLVDVAEQTLEQ
ncbi:MarR family winged helix-turn-helix transcriptional regulator [Mycobacterium sp. 141]|uniref:MarR family winged helix-turn-helix transcriptional regulator n=1 Tax=Mycobacterium sp. 141 TaxID=1120797 RepID=UPI000371E16D|nr:MarR family transcriptional regulator [Mycobacterium sp. 141]